MISVSTFFSDTLHTVDAVIGNFVNNAYISFIQANSGVITLLFTVYVILIGYRFLTHAHQVDAPYLLRHLVVMLSVYGLIMSWNLYNIFVYNIFTNEPETITQVLVNASGSLPTNITTTLDSIYEQIIKVTSEFFSQVGFSASGLTFLLYGALVFLIGSAMCVVALLLFIYAKMMMAIILALGPIFILFVLWEPTKPMFAAWIRNLVTLAFIPIVTSAILCLMLSVINVTLPAINQPAQNLQFYGIAPFLGLSLATSLVLSQVFRICSSLSGGISPASLSAGMQIATVTLEKSGLSAMGRKAMQHSAHSAAHLKGQYPKRGNKS
jgi:type IV secretion system protein VirB6